MYLYVCKTCISTLGSRSYQTTDTIAFLGVRQTQGGLPHNRSVQVIISNPKLEGLLLVGFEKQEEKFSNLKERDRSIGSLWLLQKEG